MEETVVLSRREVHRAAALQQVAGNRMTLREAAGIMCMSYRQARRVYRRYRSEGLAGLVHKARGTPARNALDPALRARILDLHDHKYRDFNDTHFAEMLEEEEHIAVSRESVRRLLRQAHRPPKRRRLAPAHRSRRPRKSRRGIMVQWDGSAHHWFGPDHPPCCLLTAVDDADSSLLAALFIEAECAIGYLRLLDMMLRRHGAPLAIYQDRHTIHERGDDHWSLEEQILGVRFPTHLGRVLRELGIEPIPAFSPQAKGRVERHFGTLQDRLVAELALHDITDIDPANAWLESTFIARYHQRFARKPAQEGSAFRKIPWRDRRLKVAFAYEATVANDHCIRLGGLMIDIPAGPGRRSYARARVIVRQHLDGGWTVWHHDRQIATHPPTLLREPIRSWKRRAPGDPKGARQLLQVYLSSRPAPPQQGT